MASLSHLGLIVREGLKAFHDPAPHVHTTPWKGRCVRCGHRIGKNVVATRELPPSQWFGEIFGRAAAIRQGRQCF